ncbi:aerobic-type carbon monoxide dehydrogenase small subunit CoxS/CutS-like protein [Oleiphilus messinensis]|uniref:Aerobic-type carbon monoxide dehydrogenase small subunit CoxS/CutS-like protein n=1 Tax=Oleiphilus messinensis TaxID=141451 RepID=A0A1Y0IF14_9GAMM|nr:(2Fe-2S)-binding protein [Oleiphilus messinensis]ARU59122.1 aerobic-type carbon monoxide dehydrogenase small subunit CoxS/CutS-like protein [Oleiphilus messinensis]
MAFSININGKQQTVDVEGDTPLLWVIRDHLQLTGTKFGCGMAQCGACTVHLNGQPIRSCVTPISSVTGQQITTIEGLSGAAVAKTHKAVVDAWEEVAVVQCGYCQSGQIMSAVALLSSNPGPSDQEIDQYMNGNICRCATYVRIKQAIKQASGTLVAQNNSTDSPLYYDAFASKGNADKTDTRIGG